MITPLTAIETSGNIVHIQLANFVTGKTKEHSTGLDLDGFSTSH